MQPRACTVVNSSVARRAGARLAAIQPSKGVQSDKRRLSLLPSIASGFDLRRRQANAPEVAATAKLDQESLKEKTALSDDVSTSQSSVLSMLGSIPSKVSVTVQNNVVSAQALFTTAKRLVRLPAPEADSVASTPSGAILDQDIDRPPSAPATHALAASAPRSIKSQPAGPSTPHLTTPIAIVPPNMNTTTASTTASTTTSDSPSTTSTTTRFTSLASLTTTSPPRVRRSSIRPLIAPSPSTSSSSHAAWKPHGKHGLHPSLRLVRDRYWLGSQPGKRTDGYKLGLVVEGGGMRGIVSGAMLMQLHRLGLRDVFDAVYGASAGAINASYFLAGQADSVDIYTNFINNSDFIHLPRFFSGQPVMNMDLLLDVMHRQRPLNWQAVMDSPIPLKVVASCLDSLGPVVLDRFTDQQDLVACLRASANVPLIVGPPCEVRGRRLVDAAVFEPVPYRAALKDECTHLVVLCTRPRLRSSPIKKQLQKTVTTMLKRTVLNPTYMREAWRREVEMLTYNGMHLDDLLALALEGGEQHDVYRLHGGHVYPVYPGKPASFPPISCDTAKLQGGLEEGVRVANAVFAPLLDIDAQLRMWRAEQQHQQQLQQLQQQQVLQQQKQKQQPLNSSRVRRRWGRWGGGSQA